MTAKSFDTILDQAIDLLADGTPMHEILAMFPEHEDELRDILDVAHAVHTERTVQESESKLRHVLGNIPTVTQSNPSRYSLREKTTRVIQPFTHLYAIFRMKRAHKLGAVLAVFVMVISGGLFTLSRNTARAPSAIFDAATKDTALESGSADTFGFANEFDTSSNQKAAVTTGLERKIYADEVEESYVAPIAPPSIYPPAPVPTPYRDIIRSANLSLKVKNVQETIQRITNIASSQGGYTANSTITTERWGRQHGFVTIYVPSHHFDNDLSIIRAFGKVTNEYASADDVTGVIVDASEDIATLRDEKKELEALRRLVPDYQARLELEQQIQHKQRQIDAREGQRDDVEARVQYAQIDVSLTSRALGFTMPSGNSPVGNVLQQALQALATVFIWIGSGLLWLIVFSPLLLLVGLILALIMIPIRRRRKKQKGDNDVEVI